jgi:hypothetical protein
MLQFGLQFRKSCDGFRSRTNVQCACVWSVGGGGRNVFDLCNYLAENSYAYLFLAVAFEISSFVYSGLVLMCKWIEVV